MFVYSNQNYENPVALYITWVSSEENNLFWFVRYEFCHSGHDRQYVAPEHHLSSRNSLYMALLNETDVTLVASRSYRHSTGGMWGTLPD
jgi:hypothetical protein